VYSSIDAEAGLTHFENISILFIGVLTFPSVDSTPKPIDTSLEA
jgi:hypothetical protein